MKNKRFQTHYRIEEYKKDGYIYVPEETWRRELYKALQEMTSKGLYKHHKKYPILDVSDLCFFYRTDTPYNLMLRIIKNCR